MNDLIDVNCAVCDKELEVFADSAGFNCPYCGEDNVFVDADDAEEEIKDIVTDSDILVLNRSTIQSWCSRHKETTEHSWMSDRRTGQRLFCLVCWPSKLPSHPIRHVKKENL